MVTEPPPITVLGIVIGAKAMRTLALSWRVREAVIRRLGGAAAHSIATTQQEEA